MRIKILTWNMENDGEQLAKKASKPLRIVGAPDQIVDGDHPDSPISFVQCLG